MALLAQALGVLRYAPADDLLQKYIPMGVPIAVHARAAAVWTLGHLHDGDPDPQLTKKLRKCLTLVLADVSEMS